jgi:glycosyltransferase involved in cell wall biosynthesis
MIASSNAEPDIIMLSLARPDQPMASASLALAAELAKRQRVFYIEHPLSVKDVIKEFGEPHVIHRRKALMLRRGIYHKLPNYPEQLRVVTPPVTLPINKLPPGRAYNYLAERNNRLIFGCMRGIIKDFGISEWIYVNSFDPFFAQRIPQDIKPVLQIYQCLDDIAEVPYTARHGVRLEQEIARNSDFCISSSTALRKQNEAFNARSYLFPNASNPDLFEPVARNPEQLPPVPELEDIPGPVIGFTGSLEYRSDYALIDRIARHYSDKQLVFVGPLRTKEMHERGIADLPNVHLLPSRDIRELPACVKYMDVMIIPYKKNKLTHSIYPLKINEYLAAGKPVVATNFAPDIEGFGDVASIARNDDEFIEMIDSVLKNDDAQQQKQRMARARQNSWAARAETFRELVEKHLPG